MAKFQFTLSSLLRLRELERDDRRTALAQAYRAEAILKAQRQKLEAELMDLIRRCRNVSAPGHVDVDGLLEVRRYEMALKTGENELDKQEMAVAAEIEKRRQALAEASREVRALEKLKEKQHHRHRQEENRREIKLLDEAATLRSDREDTR
jgi:flagellar export protein FliJ